MHWVQGLRELTKDMPRKEALRAIALACAKAGWVTEAVYAAKLAEVEPGSEEEKRIREEFQRQLKLDRRTSLMAWLIAVGVVVGGYLLLLAIAWLAHHI